MEQEVIEMKQSIKQAEQIIKRQEADIEDLSLQLKKTKDQLEKARNIDLNAASKGSSSDSFEQYKVLSEQKQRDLQSDIKDLENKVNQQKT